MKIVFSAIGIKEGESKMEDLEVIVDVPEFTGRSIPQSVKQLCIDAMRPLAEGMKMIDQSGAFYKFEDLVQHYRTHQSEFGDEWLRKHGLI